MSEVCRELPAALLATRAETEQADTQELAAPAPAMRHTLIGGLPTYSLVEEVVQFCQDGVEEVPPHITLGSIRQRVQERPPV